MPLSLPHVLGPYRLVQVLGRGGMGIVYEAYDDRLDRRVAVKRMLIAHDDPKRRERLRREARTTAKLDHPSIVQIFDLVEDDEGDWLVMERIDGTPLSALAKKGPLDVDTVLEVGRQAAEGLAAAHAGGVVHRDLKAENVMITTGGRVKILDFGIAKRVGPGIDGSRAGDLSKTGEIVGTSRAMAPEQARGLTVGPRSDLFSLGVLLYELLTGVSPFRGTTPMDSLARILRDHPRPIEELAPHVPEDLSHLVGRLLRKVPELRPADAAEVARTLEGLIEERGVESCPAALEEDEDPATMVATAFLPAPEEADPSVDRSADANRSSESAFSVLGIPKRGTTRLALLALLVVAAIPWGAPRLPGTMPSPRDEATRPVDDSPSVGYEEALRALRRLEPGSPDRAIEVFRRMIERDPESAPAYAGMARAYWEKARNASAGGDPVFLDQALAGAAEAVRKNAYLADARVSLGLVLSALGRYDEAAEHLGVALELEPTHSDAHYALGKWAESVGRLDEAEDHYRRAEELRPAPLYSNALGALLYDLGRYDEAEKAFLETLALAPDDLHALRNLGAIYHAQGRLDEAAAKLQDALEIRPDASLFSNLGTVLFSRGLYSRAADAFEDALAMDGASNRYIFWLNLADTYRQLPGRSAEAERGYRRAIQMLDDLLGSRPTDVRLRSRRAVALARSGDLDAARGDIETLRRAGTGGDLYSLFRLAITEELVGERERALDTLSEALRSGFSLAEIRLEPDLVDLRADPRFHYLLAERDRGS